MEYLNLLLSNSNTPLISAIILGLMTAISPCPLATNITAIAYIGKDVDNKKLIFTNGLIYTLGRVVAYSSLGIIIYFGASELNISRFFNSYGEKFLGPILIIAGLFMLDIFHFNFGNLNSLSEKLKFNNSKLSSFLLGLIFALAFCPYSGILYFGMLIPLSISSTSGLILPPVYAIATGLPVIIVAYLLAFTLNGIGGFYNNIRKFEKWFRKITAIIFICIGLYYIYIYFA